MKVRQLNKQYSISIVLMWLVAWLYLLFPTSAPLALNGLPLDRKAEFLVFIALSLTILFAFVLRYLIRIGFFPLPYRGHQAPRFRVYLEIVAILMVLALLVFKLFFRESNQLTSCFEIPGVNDHRCVWLPEGFRIHQSDQVSRFEESITFAAPERPWRLSAFNDARVFNMFSTAEGSFERRIRDLRQSRSYPFSTTFRLGEPITSVLQREYAQDETIPLTVKYTGAVDFSGIANTPFQFPYSEVEQSQLLEIPASSIRNLAIRYQNFRCADDKQTSSQCARSLSVVSLPLEAARLEVAVIHPGDGKKIPLGYAPLLANGKRRTILLGFGVLEGLAGAMMALILLVRIYPYFSSVPTSATQIAHKARPHLKAIFQIILVAALSAFACRLFYRHVFPVGILANGAKLTILLPLGAAYIGLFWMALFSKRANQFFSAFISALGPGAAIVTLAPYFLYLWVTLCWRVSPMNEVTFLNPGDDPLYYATDGMGLLETGALRTSAWEYSYFSTKPLFIHFRALYYALFGGGETYYSVLITTAFVCVWSLVIGLSVLAVASKVNVGAAASSRVRIAIAAACTIAYVTLGRMFLALGASFAGSGFSEGPAWLFALGCGALLVTLTNSGHPILSMWLTGVLFAASLCFRTQYVMYLPLVVFLCAFLRQDVSWKRLFTCLGLPSFVIGVLLLLNYLRYLPTSDEVRLLVDNTALREPFSWNLVLRHAKLLFPSALEFLGAVTVLALLVWVWVAKGGVKRMLFLFFAYASTICILNWIVAGNAGYYPRNLVMSFFLSGCASIALIQNRFVTARNQKPSAAQDPSRNKSLLFQRRSANGIILPGL